MCRWGEETEIIAEMKKLEKTQGKPDSAANMVKDTESRNKKRKQY